MKSFWTNLAAATFMVLPAAAGERPMVNVDCKPTDEKLVYHCIFNVMEKKSRMPIEGAVFKVNADMPAMPMAHNVKAIEPQLVAGKPGMYQGSLHLEMVGEWALKMTFNKPIRDIVVKKLMFGDMAMGGDHSTDGKEKMEPSGHGKHGDQTNSE